MENNSNILPSNIILKEVAIGNSHYLNIVIVRTPHKLSYITTPTTTIAQSCLN